MLRFFLVTIVREEVSVKLEAKQLFRNFKRADVQ